MTHRSFLSFLRIHVGHRSKLRSSTWLSSLVAAPKLWHLRLLSPSWWERLPSVRQPPVLTPSTPRSSPSPVRPRRSSTRRPLLRQIPPWSPPPNRSSTRRSCPSRSPNPPPIPIRSRSPLRSRSWTRPPRPSRSRTSSTRPPIPLPRCRPSRLRHPPEMSPFRSPPQPNRPPWPTRKRKRPPPPSTTSRPFPQPVGMACRTI